MLTLLGFIWISPSPGCVIGGGPDPWLLPLFVLLSRPLRQRFDWRTVPAFLAMVDLVALLLAGIAVETPSPTGPPRLDWPGFAGGGAAFLLGMLLVALLWSGRPLPERILPATGAWARRLLSGAALLLMVWGGAVRPFAALTPGDALWLLLVLPLTGLYLFPLWSLMADASPDARRAPQRPLRRPVKRLLP